MEVIIMLWEINKREKQEVNQATAEQLISAGNAYSPDVDIVDNKDALCFVIDLPGVAKGDVAIDIDENNVLSVRAKTSLKEPEGAVLKQFESGNYYRAFSLSDEFNKDAVNATLENGVLEITIPRREEMKPRKVQISV
jgi:HSP20 family protein